MELWSNCSRSYNPGQKSLGQYCNIPIFLLFLGSLLKWYIIFEIFLQFSLPLPYTKLKLRKNSGYTHPTLFVGWGEGLDLCELENTPETQKCPKTFVHDCSYYACTLKFIILLLRVYMYSLCIERYFSRPCLVFYPFQMSWFARWQLTVQSVAFCCWGMLTL